MRDFHDDEELTNREKAQRLLAAASTPFTDRWDSDRLAAAQVYATLALIDATEKRKNLLPAS